MNRQHAMLVWLQFALQLDTLNWTCSQVNSALPYTIPFFELSSSWPAAPFSMIDWLKGKEIIVLWWTSFSLLLEFTLYIQLCKYYSKFRTSRFQPAGKPRGFISWGKKDTILQTAHAFLNDSFQIYPPKLEPYSFWLSLTSSYTHLHWLILLFTSLLKRGKNMCLFLFTLIPNVLCTRVFL